jgi:hypothetical protein
MLSRSTALNGLQMPLQRTNFAAFAVVFLVVIPEGDLLLLFEKPPPNESASSSEFS